MTKRPFHGSGGRTRTCDLRVMSPTSYRTAPPRIASNSIHGGRASVKASAAAFFGPRSVLRTENTAAERSEQLSKRLLQYGLGLGDNLLSVLLAQAALRVDLCNILGAGGPHREPAMLRLHLDAAERLDANLICFPGGRIHSMEAFENQRNVLYDLVGEDCVDGIVTWSSARCEILPRLEEPYMVASPELDRIMEMVHWLIRLRIPNECFVVNRVNLAAMMAKSFPEEYQEIKNSLSPWILFYNLAGYEYYPEERVRVHEEDVKGIAQRAGVEPRRAAGKVSAFDLLRASQAPSPEPYWKLRMKGACQEIFFIANFQGVAKTIDAMYEMVAKADYPATDLGVYIQPIVQGVNYHVEFDLFYDPASQQETARIRELVNSSVERLIECGAFFSRPYGELTRQILNRDESTVSALRKVKSILDPDNIMNPGKLCF